MKYEVYNGDLHEAALAMQKTEPSLSYQEALFRAADIAKSKGSTKAPAHDPAGDSKAFHDRRHEAISVLSAELGVSYVEAAQAFAAAENPQNRIDRPQRAFAMAAGSEEPLRFVCMGLPPDKQPGFPGGRIPANYFWR